MKYLIALFILFSSTVNSQTTLKFDTTNIESVDKWVVFQKAKDSVYYNFGFIYLDSSAGLTLHYEGKFKIDEKGNFKKEKTEVASQTTFMKVRMEPNKNLIAQIPENKLKELGILKTPDWLKIYKGEENSVENLYKIGYLYNGYNQFEKALELLQKAEKINPKFKALQTELAFSYNALNRFDDAEIALKKAINQNPKDCYTYKELAYTYTKKVNFKMVEETYNKMVKICDQKNFIQETAHNLAYEYYKLKDKTNFKKWKEESVKWSDSDNQFTQNLKQMELELKE